MASPEPEAVAKVDVPYVNRGLPLTFFGVKHSRWTKKGLVEIIEALGGAANKNTTKIDLYETIHDRYNPQRILQRTIDAVGVIAQAAAGQGQKPQREVREALQDRTIERADLAREKRDAAKRGEAIPKQQPRHRTERLRDKLDPNLDGDEDLDLDKDSEYEDDVVGPRRRQPPVHAQRRDGHRARGRKGKDSSNTEDEDDRQVQSSALRKGQRRRKRKDDSDLEEYSDDEVLEVLRRVHQQMRFGDEEVDRRNPRKREASPTLERETAKRRKTDITAEVKVKPPGPPAVVFSISIAIRDSAAFRVGLEPIDRATLGEQPSCQVCADDLDPWLQFQVSVASKCSHAPEICLSCWEQHIASQADSKTWNSITCPHADCGATLNHGDMQRFAPTEVFRRYDKFETNKALQNAPGYRLCAHEGCGSGGFVDDEPPTYMTCADCQKHTCLGCNLVYHHPQTCDEYRLWLVDAPKGDEAGEARVKEQERAEKESSKYLDKNSKTCPNGACGAKIQKTDGCDHMACRICRHEFCWLCLADFTNIRRDGNHWHAPSCHYHSDGTPGH
jgi:IBR domain, a half RING-finger domain